MEFLSVLWLPILLSAVFVFVVSSILHMVIPIHRGDYDKLDNEDELMAAMREKGLKPGTYMLPCPGSMKEMGSPEMLAKYKEGPVAFMTVFPNGAPALGKNLIQWFLYSLLISAIVAYVAWFALDDTARRKEVLQIAGVVAVLGYGLADFPTSIWKGQKWTTTAKFLFDGIIYGIVTAGTFVWLWPSH